MSITVAMVNKALVVALAAVTALLIAFTFARLTIHLAYVQADNAYRIGDYESAKAQFKELDKGKHPHHKLSYAAISGDFSGLDDNQYRRPLWYQQYWLEFVAKRDLDSLENAIATGGYLPHFEQVAARYLGFGFRLDSQVQSVLESYVQEVEVR